MNAPDLLLEARSRAPAIDGAFDILDVLVQSTWPLTLSEIAQRVGLPVASCHRMIGVLLRRGLVMRDLRRRKAYCAGARLFEMASAAYLQQPVVPLFHPIADVLKNELHQSVSLSVAAGSHALVVAYVSWPFADTYGVHVGRTEDMHESAAGRAMMSMLDAGVQVRYWAEFMSGAIAPEPVAKEAQWLRELADIKRVGYALIRPDAPADVCSLAVPVLNRRGEPMAAMGITVKALRDVRSYATPLIQAAWQLSARLG